MTAGKSTEATFELNGFCADFSDFRRPFVTCVIGYTTAVLTRKTSATVDYHLIRFAENPVRLNGGVSHGMARGRERSSISVGSRAMRGF